ncbi:AlpA family transcriptional regulator [Cellvibrio sp. pealriver]|uniref:helix-turn-helix transcriptional regulator n=1 Tax=Cellvibrio sp. pealriver TaxID=1622269 RepID=UPI00066FBBAE|nr:AlpA family phage regulatory protein [Cellvibrio sp. pealriver]
MVNPTPIKNQELGFYRVPQITELLCISKSTWWLWVQNGKAPKGRKLSPGVTVWSRSSIHAFIEKLEAESTDTTPPEAA